MMIFLICIASMVLVYRGAKWYRKDIIEYIDKEQQDGLSDAALDEFMYILHNYNTGKERLTKRNYTINSAKKRK